MPRLMKDTERSYGQQQAETQDRICGWARRVMRAFASRLTFEFL